MEQETPNDSVWPILLIIDFVATKLVARIFLRFIWFLSCDPLFFEFLALVLQRWYLTLDIMSWFLLGIDGGRSDLFLIVKAFSFPSALNVELLPLVKYGLLLLVWKLRPVWVKSGKYCATCSLDDSLWCFIATSVNLPNCPGGVVSYVCGLFRQTVGNNILSYCVGLVQVIGELEWGFDLIHNRIWTFWNRRRVFCKSLRIFPFSDNPVNITFIFVINFSNDMDL